MPNHLKPDPREPAHHYPILAIDPGKSGGVAWLDWTGTTYARPLPRAASPMLDLLRLTVAEAAPRIALLEDVGYHRSGNAASASATLARNVGQIEAALDCCGVSIYWVPPKTWRAGVPFAGIPRRPRGVAHLTGAERRKKVQAHQRLQKRLIKELMVRQYPGVKVTLATADALAILHWGVHSDTVKNVIEVRERLTQANYGF